MMMRKLLLFTLLSAFLMTSVNADIVGTDSFDYDDGAIAGQSGGTGWDFKGDGNPQGVVPTSWLHMAGATDVAGGTLVLNDTGDGWIAARREFGSDTWGAAAFQSTGIVYFASTVTIDVIQGWLGISAMDGDQERVKYGLPWQDGAFGFLGINRETDGGLMMLSDVQAVVDQPYRIVGVLDFNNNAARMWVDPDSGDYDTAWDHTSADVVLNSLGMTNWINGVRISSGGGTTWDDVIVATAFGETFVPGSLALKPHDPDPAAGELNVEVDAITVSWNVPRDPNNVALIDPNLVSMKLYMDADPNTVEIDFIADVAWDGMAFTASHEITDPDLKQRDMRYYWRVDSLKNTAETVQGDVWVFDTEKSTPEITADPEYQVVEAMATASFSVTVDSLSPATYQWYLYVDGVNDTPLSDGGDITGAQASTLEIANVELADEDAYYCVVNNDSGVPDTSETALLGVKRRISYWSFEDNDANNLVAGSPATIIYGDPVFEPGIIGDGMAFDADVDAIDLLYTNPYEASYFDICNYTMTVSCWIKASSATTWGPMVARNGEGLEGWQLRHNGNTLDKVCFTTRGTGNDDGTATDVTAYDGDWHFVVGTYDGMVKKVYIDGVLNVTDDVSGLVNGTESPVALAGRVKGGIGTLEFESVTACTLDDVSIYNYVLDPVTIAQEYADGANVSVCPGNPAYDLDGDCRVDLDDFALLAGQWLLDNTVSPQ